MARKAKTQEDQLIDEARFQQDVIATFDTVSGRKVLDQLSKSCFIFKTTHVPGDPEKSKMNEGARMVVADLLKIMEKDTTYIRKLIAEGQVDEND